MKRTVILTCKPVLMWQDAQLLRGLFAQGGVAPELVETGCTAQLLAALEGQLPRYDRFFVAADPAVYHALKALLLSCLGFACEPRPEIVELQSRCGDDALFPRGAHVFLTRGGCCNGFALHSGRQELLMLPLEAELLGQLAPQVLEYTLPPELYAVQPPAPAPLAELQFLSLGTRSAPAIDEISPADIEPLVCEPRATVYEPQAAVYEPQAAVLRTAPDGEKHPANTNAGRGRAMVAASLALCSLVASLFLTLYFGNRGPQPEITSHEVIPAAAGYASPNILAAGAGVTYDTMMQGLLRFICIAQKILDAAAKQPVTTRPPVTTIPPPTTTKTTATTKPTVTTAWWQTQPPATTQPTVTTQAPATTTQPPATTQPSAAKGVFRFAVQGYGHGVGMSQEGAREYARQGWDYERILMHYYSASGISIARETARATIVHGGKTYGITEYLARIAFCEIGGPNHSADEAIKAQMVCAYTIAKRNSYKTTENNQHILVDSKWNTAAYQQYKDKMYRLAQAVLGRYVSYNGKAADTLVFASCMGMTASAKYAWSGSEPEPYLRGGRYSPEAIDRTTPSFTRAEIQAMVKTYNGKYPNNKITLGSNPAQWIQILRTDTNGYVEQLQIGDRTFTGGNARLYFFGSTVLRSHNFTVQYE